MEGEEEVSFRVSCGLSYLPLLGLTRVLPATFSSFARTSMSPEEHDVTGALQIGFANDEGRDKESLTERERAFARSLSGLKNRLRDLLFVKHSALFFSGHAYFNMQDAEKETEAYGSAERLRQTLLQVGLLRSMTDQRDRS